MVNWRGFLKPRGSETDTDPLLATLCKRCRDRDLSNICEAQKWDLKHLKHCDCDFCRLLHDCTKSRADIELYYTSPKKRPNRVEDVDYTTVELKIIEPYLIEGRVYNTHLVLMPGATPRHPGRVSRNVFERSKPGFFIQQSFDGLHEDTTGKLATQSEVSYELLRKWKQQCEKSHLECGTVRPKSEAQDMNIQVVDLEKYSISELPQGQSFIALSYVWGKADSLTALSTNIADLRQPEGLRQFMHLIPRTIQDCFTLAQHLGERYVWIDSLCIVQDDPITRDSQIANMHFIYGLATLTVVAADGTHANAGLPGVGDKSRYLHYHNRRGPDSVCLPVRRALTFVAPVDRLETAPSTKPEPVACHSLKETPWSKRAWTFQEQFLSSRFLVFTEQQVFWHCKECIWCEPIWGRKPDSSGFHIDPRYTGLDTLRGDRRYAWAQGIDRSLEVKRDGRIIVVRSEAFSLYTSCVTLFTPRDIGFDNDILNAFQGIASELGNVLLKSEFLYGLPSRLFDLALLWRPAAAGQLIRRRAGSFPSWSWAGWLGPIQYEENYGVAATERRAVSENESPEERLRPCVKYYTYGDKGIPFALNGSGLGLAEAALPDGSFLPTWRPLNGMATSGRPEDLTDVDNGTRSKILTFWTWTAHFKVEQARSYSSGTFLESLHVIIDGQENCVGEVYLDESHDDFFRQGRTRNFMFTVISEAQFFFDDNFNKGRNRSNSTKYKAPNGLQTARSNLYSKLTEFQLFNVLAVTDIQVRSQNIRERLGIGRIYKDSFVAANPQEGWISLV